MPHLPDFEKAELSRLQEEIQRDRDLQFRVFWQAVTVTAVLFSLSVSVMKSDLVISFPFIFLVPHLILIPSTAIILNRARTGNRKNAYLLTRFDEFATIANWEKDLALLRNFNPDNEETLPQKSNSATTRTHRAATLKSMILTITLLEIFSLLTFGSFAFTYIMFHNDLYSQLLPYGCFIYTAIYFTLVAKRLRSYFCTKYETSIQGYANVWAKVLGIDKSKIDNFPQWEIENWKEIRNEELSSHSQKSFLKINWSWFIWVFLFQTHKKNHSQRVPPSWLRPIIFSAWFMAVFVGLFYATEVHEIIRKILKM